MRIVGIIALCLSLGGCGAMAAKQQEERVAQIKSQGDGIIADCDGKFPAVKGQFVNRQRCKRPALELYKQLTPYPDLVDQEIAMRMAVSEKLDTGKMTMAEAELATAQSHSLIMSEEQRRNLSSRSVEAQESVAAASWRGVSCNKIGNTVNCF
jgi:hypothetical protein